MVSHIFLSSVKAVGKNSRQTVIVLCSVKIANVIEVIQRIKSNRLAISKFLDRRN